MPSSLHLRSCALLLTFVSVSPPLIAQSPQAPARDGFWETATVDGARVGTAQTTTRPAPGGALRTGTDLRLQFRRNGSLVRLRMESGTDETVEGKVVGVFMRQYHGDALRLTLEGQLEDEALRVKIDGGRIDRKLRWGDDVVGLKGLDDLFVRRKAAPGDRFTVLRYEPTLNAVLTVRVAVREAERVEFAGEKKALVRVEMTPDRLVVPGQTVQPGRTVWWLDEAGAVVRRQFELEGLGTVTLTRSTQEAATRAPRDALGPLPDLGFKTLIPLNRTIPRPYATRAITYRIGLKDDPDPTTAFASDDHQRVGAARGGLLEVVVRPVRPTRMPGETARPGQEYLAANYFLDADSDRVRTLAARAVGDETDPWRKALRIERWVKNALRIDQDAPLSAASEVATHLRGDCRAAAILAAAMCRAAGVPSRTAVGLLYVFRGKPTLGFHMWTEVWVAGRWVGIDGVLGLGGVSGAHLKIADHSWHEVRSQTPLLPVSRVLGKMTVEVVGVEAGE